MKFFCSGHENLCSRASGVQYESSLEYKTARKCQSKFKRKLVSCPGLKSPQKQSTESFQEGKFKWHINSWESKTSALSCNTVKYG